MPAPPKRRRAVTSPGSASSCRGALERAPSQRARTGRITRGPPPPSPSGGEGPRPRIEQSNFHDSPLLRITEAPRNIHVHPGGERRPAGGRGRAGRAARGPGRRERDLRGHRRAPPRAAAGTASAGLSGSGGAGGGTRAPGRNRLRVGRNRPPGDRPGQGRDSVPGLDRAWRALQKAPRARPPGCRLTREPPAYCLRSHRGDRRGVDDPAGGMR